MSVTYIHSHPSYYICPLTTLAGVYATTLMAVLNSRIKFSRKYYTTTWKDSPSEIDFPMRHLAQSMQRGSNNIEHGFITEVIQEEPVRNVKFDLKQVSN